MKIAQIAPPWITIPPKNYGGTENVIYNLVEALVVRGHDVTLFTTGDSNTSAKQVSFLPQSLIDSGVPWQPPLKAYYHHLKSIEYINAHDFDIVHTHLSSTPDLYTFPLTAQLNVPHVTTLHSHFPFDKTPDGWRGDVDAYYIKEWGSSVPLVAISESARRQAPEGLNFVGVVHHGLLMKQFQPTGQPEGYFAWIGRCSPEKGTHLAIQAAKAAGVRLVMAGVVGRNNKAIQYYQEVVKPQIDNEQITFLGPADMQQKIDLLSRASGFLNPIQWEEPFGMVMIESMALGCPVISFARGAAPEIIVHSKTGFLVHDLDEMVRCIPCIGKIDREATRMHVERNFSAHTMDEHYLKIYQKIIDESKTASKATTHTNSPRKPIISSAHVLCKTTIAAHSAYKAEEEMENTRRKSANSQ
jgi:glycosyltransferase involved in cell wall biosynthesis